MATLRSIDRKLSRQRDQRRVLIKTLATQLVEHHRVTTSAPKAKALKPYVERLVSQAVKGGLARRRLVRAKLDTAQAANHLFDLIAPQMKRTSGFLTHQKSPARQGDLTPMTTLNFVDSIADELPKAAAAKAKATKPRSKASPATTTKAKPATTKAKS